MEEERADWAGDPHRVKSNLKRRKPQKAERKSPYIVVF
jgi:hypothetical protein